ncbi:MAG TPA: hypothetical protein VIK19_09235 [Syntrophales bacterium]
MLKKMGGASVPWQPTDRRQNWIIQQINGRDLLKIDEKNSGNLKKIPAESQLTTRYH